MCAVIKHKAELGIVFDTDVDRSGVVDASGRAVNKNKLIALMAAVTLRDAPSTTVVTDSVTSSGLTKFIEAHGGKHLRCVRRCCSFAQFSCSEGAVWLRTARACDNMSVMPAEQL
jgi:phosphoglucomutase